MDEDFIKIKPTSYSKKKYSSTSRKDKTPSNTNFSAATTSNSKQESSEIDFF